MPYPTHKQPPYCDANGMRLLAEKDKRIAELEAAIADALRKADANGMGAWPTFRALRKMLPKST